MMMSYLTSPRLIGASMAAVLFALVSACGGGGGAGATTPAPPTAVVIGTQPADQTVVEGASAAFTVSATGDGLNYQWQRSTDAGSTWSNVTGGTTSTLTLNTTALTQNGERYRVQVAGTANSVTSNVASLNVNALVIAPSITSDVSSQTVVAGGNATFAVIAAGKPLNYQWQFSTDAGATWADVAGAVGASFSVNSAALTDSGKRWRVRVSNGAGSVTSTAGVLTVTPAPVAPTFTLQPKSVSVTAPAQADFSITATGSPTPTLQWQLSTNGGTTWADITGATAARYLGTTVLRTSDNGNRYRVLATNAGGSTTSNVAVLTVNAPPTSTLSGRAWSPGQLLESDDNPVVNYSAGIDDAGNVTAVFVKSDGVRNVLWAVRGTPGNSGASPLFAAPTAIDTGAAVDGALTITISVAPSGNAVATWFNTAACTATSYSTTGNCIYLVTARYLAGTGTWEAPKVVASMPPGTFGGGLINDAGTVLLYLNTWQRSGTTYTTAPGLAWRESGQTAYQVRPLPDANVTPKQYALDAANNIVLAAAAVQSSGNNLVVYRGNTGTTLGPLEALSTPGSTVAFRRMAMGTNGQIAVLWDQTKGTGSTVFAAVAANVSDSFTATDLNTTAAFTELAISDAGNLVGYDFASLTMVQRVGTLWTGVSSLPAGINRSGSTGANTARAVNRNGNVLSVQLPSAQCDDGQWSTFDAATSAVIKPFARAASTDFVLGLDTCPAATGLALPLLAANGVGAVFMLNTFDVLPSVGAPAGSGRAVKNLWGSMLK